VSSYFVLRVSGLSTAGESWLSERAFDFGALGMAEVLAFDQPEGEETVFTRRTDVHTVDIYFGQPPCAEFVDQLTALYPEARLTVNSEQERDWMKEWKKQFKPFCLINPHWVVPSWCEPPAAALHKIWIDPGMAFGTGTHETTQLGAEELKRICGARRVNSVLDVGTGTGILAILARQLGIATVHATEIEADARRVALDNFALNDCGNIRLDARQIDDLEDTYDVVVANIIDGVLVRVQEDLKARVRKGGVLIMSGIITEREKDFLAGFKLPSGCRWLRRAQKGDWLLYSVILS
jgi:ribosomal protein L11 methyltransferase